MVLRRRRQRTRERHHLPHPPPPGGFTIPSDRYSGGRIGVRGTAMSRMPLPLNPHPFKKMRAFFKLFSGDIDHSPSIAIKSESGPMARRSNRNRFAAGSEMGPPPYRQAAR